MQLFTKVAGDRQGLVALKREWEGLLADSAQDSLFMTHEWLATWWSTYGPSLNGKLHVISVRDQVGDLVGLAPFFIHPMPGPVENMEVRTLRFLGTGGDTSPDYMGIVARRGMEEQVVRAVVDSLVGPAAPRWHGMLMSDMVVDAPMTGSLLDYLKHRLGSLQPVTAVSMSACPYVELPATPDLWWSSIPRKLRYNVRSRQRKLVQNHEGRFFTLNDAEEAGEGLKSLAHLHHKRFNLSAGGSCSFSSPEYMGFHHSIMVRMMKSGRLRLHCLDARKQRVAMLYCIRYGDRIYHLQSGFDPDWGSAGVGQLLISHAIDSAIAEGVRFFDFLKGDYPYKVDWATGKRRTCAILAARPGVRGAYHLYSNHWRREMGRNPLLRFLRRVL